ncbi:MAG: hypothetical protein AB9869_07210 [Verrucomicrobiia bacterium]
MNGHHKTPHPHRSRETSECLSAWGKLPVYRARILASDVVDVVVKSARRLAVGERIAFATLPDLAASETQRPTQQKWRSGIIWRIEKGTLRLTST